MDDDGKRWLLIVFAVPDRLGGLLARLGFKPAKKNPANWWLRFNPYEREARSRARACLQKLRSAGARYSWKEVEAEPRRLPDEQVMSIKAAAERRLAMNAAKRAEEMRRQEELVAARDAERRAQEALRRARGE